MRRWLIAPLGIFLGWLFLVSTLLGAGRSSFALQLTLTPNAYLPLVANRSALTATPTAAPTAAPTGTPVPPDDLANEQSIIHLINQNRSANGLPPFTLVSELTQAARRHSRDMADTNFTGHTGSDGSNGGQRMQEAGYEWARWAETIGWGFSGNPASMVNWWMNSSIHRGIILSDSLEDLGVGYARNPDSDYGHYWTVNYATRAGMAQNRPGPEFACVHATAGASAGSVMLHGPEPCR
ncbi:MAG: hypothetical protein GQ526_04865 [Ardenticatenales bacterium]|nr:hypothetical protein [Ardenticatenales bacterium]